MLESSPERDSYGSGRASINHKLIFAVFMIAVAGGLVAAIIRHNEIIDSLRLRGYNPPANIAEIANQTAMTPYGKRLFYVNHPAVEGKDAFNQHCPNASREIAVLGCYRGDRNGIYVYHVTDERLYGIEQVTAAHEMLHQAYDRLSSAERKRINKQLQDYYATVTDQGIKDKMAEYKKIEPNDLENEMHSVFGTEAANLPADLEGYYKKYFSDRKQVLAYYVKSNQAFVQRKQQIADYDSQLERLKVSIDTTKAEIAAQEANLNTRKATMDAYLASNQISAYNAAVPGYNAQVEEYKAKVAAVNSQIDQYNSIIAKRNAIAVEEDELIKAQNSQAESSANTQ